MSDNTLLTVGFDKVINSVDVRDTNSFARGVLPKNAGDVESASWHPTMENNLVLSTESGQVFGFDTRKMNAPVFSVHAHEQACSQVQFSPHIPSMMVTSGTDGYVKVWDVSSGTPTEIATRDVKQGELFTMQFCRDIPWVVAAGGSKGELAIWDLSES